VVVWWSMRDPPRRRNPSDSRRRSPRRRLSPFPLSLASLRSPPRCVGPARRHRTAARLDDQVGNTPLKDALRDNHPEVAALLRKRGGREA